MVDKEGRVLRMPMMLDDQLDALKASKTNHKKVMTGTHTYDILSNPSYFDDFQYVPVMAGDGCGILREDIIKDDDEDEGNDYWVSDKVRVGLNLAFITQKQADKFDISDKELKFTDCNHGLTMAAMLKDRVADKESQLI